jgi:hypothetical protein
LSSGCHADRKAANFSSAVCSPTGETVKNAETGFMRWFPVCPYRQQWVAKSTILVYIVKVIFSKIAAFKDTTGTILNMVAVHIEDPMHPHPHHKCLPNTLFLCHCPFNQTQSAGLVSM